MSFKLYQGVCLEVMDQLIQEKIKFDAIITDPPYGITQCEWDTEISLNKIWKRINLLRRDITPIVLFGSEPFSSYLRMSNIKEFKYDWIWEKNTGAGFLNANRIPLNSYEVISVFYKKQSYYCPVMTEGKAYSVITKSYDSGCYGKRGSTTYKNITSRFPRRNIKFNIVPNTKGHKVHSTQKPVELMEYLIKTYTKENDLVLDFTMGSGTTGVAAIKLNRNFIGIEIEKEYFDIAESRIKYQVSFNKLSEKLKNKRS